MQTEFFDHLYEHCAGMIEIRLLPSGQQCYFELDELDQLTQYVKKNGKQDTYFGVATRDGKGGTKDNIVSIPAVWCDADFKDIDRKELFKRLKDFPFPPSIIVKSGGGAHLYWQLDEPSGKDDIPKIEDCNRRIAAHFGGDLNSTDAVRILRVPDTKNRKYRPARDVKVSQINPFYYVLNDFLDLLPEVKATRTVKSGNGKPEKWLLEALRGATQGQRNATAAKIAGFFINKLPYRDVLTILTAYGCHCSPQMNPDEVANVVKSIVRYRSTSEAQDETQRERVTLSFNRG